MNQTPFLTIHQIAQVLGATYEGNGDLPVHRLCHPSTAKTATDLAMAASQMLVKSLPEETQMAVVLEQATLPEGRLKAIIRVPSARTALHLATELFNSPAKTTQAATPQRHPMSDIHPSAHIPDSAYIGPFCHIGAKVRIGENAILISHISIGPNASIGEHAQIFEGVRIGAECQIGHHVTLHANACIGASDGFSFLAPQMGETNGFHESGYPRIASLGSVTIGNHVEIGANTTVDRGTLRNTEIGNGTKIDNLVQVAHNVIIAENCMICAQVGIAGSSEIGENCILGGQAGISNHTKIGANCMIGASSGVSTNVKAGSIALGTPAIPVHEARQIILETRRLPKLNQRISKLEKTILALEDSTK